MMNDECLSYSRHDECIEVGGGLASAKGIESGLVEKRQKGGSKRRSCASFMKDCDPPSSARASTQQWSCTGGEGGVCVRHVRCYDKFGHPTSVQLHPKRASSRAPYVAQHSKHERRRHATICLLAEGRR